MSANDDLQAIVTFGSASVMLPLDDAITVFRLMSRGVAVEQDWARGMWKVPKRSSPDVSVSILSLTDLAKINLNSD